MMDESRFSEFLRESAPQTVPLVNLAANRERILAEARSRRRRRFGAGAGALVAAALFVGGGSMAVAGSGFMTPWGWTAENIFSFAQEDGSTCFQGMRIVFHDMPDDSPIVIDAREILRGIDIGSLDTTDVEKDLEFETTEAGGGLSDDELRQSAIGTMVAEILFAELSARGHDVTSDTRTQISMSTDVACD